MGFAPGPPPGSKAPWTPIYYGRIRSLRVALLLAYGRIRSLRLAQPLVASRSKLKLQVDLPTSVYLSPSPPRVRDGRRQTGGQRTGVFQMGRRRGGEVAPPLLKSLLSR